MNSRKIGRIALVSLAALTVAMGGANAADKGSRDLAKSWVAGEIENLGGPEITYDGDPITLRFTSHVPEASTQAKFFLSAFGLLEKMTNGKLKVEARWSGTVHNVREGFDANRNNITDMAACFTFLNINNFPLTASLSLPGMFPDGEVLSLVAEELTGKYFAAEFEKQGVYLSGITGSARFNIFSTKPVTTLEDLQGLKIRSGGGMSQQIFEAFGSVPVNMSSGEFFSGMQRGLIDAVFTSDAAAKTFRINEVATDHTDTPINIVPLEYCMNKATVDGLPADLREALYVWARQRSQADTQLILEEGAELAAEQFKKEGMKYHQIDPEEFKRWQTKFEPLVEKYIADGEAKGLPTRQLVEDIRAAVAKYSGMTHDELMQTTIDNPVPGVSPVN